MAHTHTENPTFDLPQAPEREPGIAVTPPVRPEMVAKVANEPRLGVPDVAAVFRPRTVGPHLVAETALARCA